MNFLLSGCLASILISLGFYVLGIKKDLKKAMDIPTMLMITELYKPIDIKAIQFRLERKDGEVFQRKSFLLQSTTRSKYFLVSFDFQKKTFKVNEVETFENLPDGRKVPRKLGELKVLKGFNELVDLLDKN